MVKNKSNSYCSFSTLSGFCNICHFDFNATTRLLKMVHRNLLKASIRSISSLSCVIFSHISFGNLIMPFLKRHGKGS